MRFRGIRHVRTFSPRGRILRVGWISAMIAPEIRGRSEIGRSRRMPRRNPLLPGRREWPLRWEESKP